jgi:ribosomal-protein-serine acetyltransferase
MAMLFSPESAYRPLVECRIHESAVLKEILPRHAVSLHRAIDENRQHLRRWLPWVDASTTPDYTRSFIEHARRQNDARQGFHCALWIEGKVAGVIGLHSIDWSNRTTTIGYWIVESAQGKGLATRASAAVITHCFAVLDLHRIEIHCATENTRSRRIPERLGFSLEGTLREVEWLYDHYVDHAIYGLLRQEWQTGGRPE